MIKKHAILLFFISISFINPSSSNAQNFPTNGEVSEELQMGGPSIDYLNLEFPRPGVTKCSEFPNEVRTINGDINKYGKALLMVIFPKDCPYCIIAANSAGAIVDKYRSQLTVWYANQRLNGEGSCGDITEMSNKYPFVKNADFKFIDVYMWNNAWNSSWHYGSQDSYWSRKESPSVYRIFNPKTKKVTGIDYYLGPIENQIKLAVADNFIPTGIQETSVLKSYEIYPNPSNSTLNLNINLETKEEAKVSIYNTQGKEVRNFVLNNSSSFRQPIDIANFSEGIYFITVSINGVRIIKDKFIKK